MVENERCKILWGMTVQCDHVIEARRPDIVVVEKERNKTIIVDIASLWDHRVYENEGEKIDKYRDLKREIGKVWVSDGKKRFVGNSKDFKEVVGRLGTSYIANMVLAVQWIWYSLQSCQQYALTHFCEFATKN